MTTRAIRQADIAREPSRRIRSSQTALENALAVLERRGLPVHKLLIVGGQYELHVGTVEQEPEQKTRNCSNFSKSSDLNVFRAASVNALTIQYETREVYHERRMRDAH